MFVGPPSSLDDIPMAGPAFWKPNEHTIGGLLLLHQLLGGRAFLMVVQWVLERSGAAHSSPVSSKPSAVTSRPASVCDEDEVVAPIFLYGVVPDVRDSSSLGDRGEEAETKDYDGNAKKLALEMRNLELELTRTERHFWSAVELLWIPAKVTIVDPVCTVKNDTPLTARLLERAPAITSERDLSSRRGLAVYLADA
ncbi:hypothetical protein THAOC_06932 [Thalassiosira oceanica]|uniref:Uncharacterized protein n=1 Tax=Thalassiosira oceanica TaxID=159749 RepID=K0T1I9_THAOC|nr:hypothetical protein THAOC_06932 [Thalassiosira oceanica]|eukprot:EJK71605.1 hypothetical protein THAOC_06932 [Thalassiosira oceanica]